MLCTQIGFCFDIQNNLCTQHVLNMFSTCSELEIFVLNSKFNEQSVVILWVSWCKNKAFWQRSTCKEGCVEDQESGKVLTVLDDKIVLEDKDEPLSDRQKWFRGVKDADGWFPLKKPLTYTIPDEDTKNLTEVSST